MHRAGARGLTGSGTPEASDPLAPLPRFPPGSGTDRSSRTSESKAPARKMPAIMPATCAAQPKGRACAVHARPVQVSAASTQDTSTTLLAGSAGNPEPRSKELTERSCSQQYGRTVEKATTLGSRAALCHGTRAPQPRSFSFSWPLRFAERPASWTMATPEAAMASCASLGKCSAQAPLPLPTADFTTHTLSNTQATGLGRFDVVASRRWSDCQALADLRNAPWRASQGHASPGLHALSFQLLHEIVPALPRTHRHANKRTHADVYRYRDRDRDRDRDRR